MNESCAIDVRNLWVAYENNIVLKNVSVTIPTGVMVAIAGPNGGGKTTFIKSILGLITIQKGTIALFNSTAQKQAKRIAYIPQRSTIDWDFPVSVLDVVMMGRYCHIGWIKRPSDQDYMYAHQALKQVNLSAYSDKHISELSGGQQQRVFLARALAQQADLYLFDEPFIGIDITTERLIIDVLRGLRREGKTVIVVHHDLQTLSDYFDWVMLLNRHVIACGPAQHVCMPEYMCAAYGDRTLYAPKKYFT